eukprot:TRINITY_DN4607_c0_g1_i2.p1 TRINITY_DN4607_c0_g1~~TRINITY_DN4607_c0_g1_i2.p1  ORF type:complete len:253 (-),score=29.03 TRINITY_DN4607_c0_g1_i2:452-1210(-)
MEDESDYAFKMRYFSSGARIQEWKEIYAQQTSLFKVQIMSDIHLEMSFQYENLAFEVVAPYLALLGDIGNPFQGHYEQFLREQSQRYELVFVVAGNHEYYSNIVHLVDQKIKQICQDIDNVIYLHQGREPYIVDGLRIVGCPLWSHIPLSAVGTLENCMNDYSCIYVQEGRSKKRLLRCSDTNQMFQECKEYLKQQITEAKNANEKCIIFTHHKPYGTSPGFATDLSKYMSETIPLWCFGHTVMRYTIKTNF